MSAKQLSMRSETDVTLHAADIAATAVGKVTIKGGGEVVIKGQKVLQN
jgi:hypothetical protein